MGAAPSFEDHDVDTLGGAALRVMLAIVAKEPDPAERKARIMILREDGWIPDERDAA